MKIKSCRSIEGSVLIVTLGMVIILSVMVGSTLDLILQQQKLSKQTLAWNQAVYGAEAGVDIAWNELNRLTAINTNGTFMSGWTLSSGVYSKSGSIAPLTGIDGASKYSVTVQTNVTVNGTSGGAIIVAAASNFGSFSATNISRTIEVQLTPVTVGTALSFAMLAKGLIDFNGNAAVMDSFNSTTAVGGVWSTSNRRAHGSVGTNGQLIDAAGLDIYGSMQTGPGGAVTTDSGFRLFQPTSPDSGTNTISNGLKLTIADVQLPDGFSPSTTLGTVNSATTVTAAGTGTTKQVQMGSIDLNGNGKILTVSGSGTVQIYVTGTVALGGQSSITVSPDSAGSLKVEMYVAGASVDLSGNGVINSTSKAGDFVVFGLPTCTAVTINGTADYKGVIYAPQAALSLAGNARVDGAVVANTISAVGTVDFHYDEALSSMSFGAGILNFQIASWKEM